MADVIAKVGDGLWNAVLMAWEVWWALVLGFAISAIVQAWVPRERVERALAGDGLRPGGPRDRARRRVVVVLLRRDRDRQEPVPEGRLGAPRRWPSSSPRRTSSGSSGSCSGSCIGWQFTLAEYVGGLVMIALMWALLRLFVSPRDEERRARARAATPTPATSTTRPAAQLPLARAADLGRRRGRTSRTTSAATGRCCGRRSRIGFLLAGFIALLGDDFFNGLFLDDAPAAVQTLWGALIGPLIAVLSFVCSVGNVPLAAVLWSGGTQLRRRDGVHLRRPDRAADRARLPQVLRHRASRCGSPR